MKNYELTILFHPDLEMNLTPATDKIKALVEEAGGKIVKETNEGKRRLAYSIGGNDFAVYYYFEVELPPSGPAKVSSVLEITEEVLRYLIVHVDELRLKHEAKQRARQKPASETKKELADSEIKEGEEK